MIKIIKTDDHDGPCRGRLLEDTIRLHEGHARFGHLPQDQVNICQYRPTYTVDGVSMCRKHAARAALEALER